jgi:O-antigen ligase
MSIMAIASVATVSLGGYVDLTVVLTALLATALFRGRLRARGLAGLLAAALLLAGAGVLTPPGRQLTASIAGRARLLAATQLESRDGAGLRQGISAAMRFASVKDSLRLFRMRPLTGIGMGQFPAFQRRINRRPIAEAQPWTGWIGIAAELGFLGPALLAFPLVIAVRRRGPPAAVGTLLLPALVAVLAVQAPARGLLHRPRLVVPGVARGPGRNAPDRGRRFFPCTGGRTLDVELNTVP